MATKKITKLNVQTMPKSEEFPWVQIDLEILREGGKWQFYHWRSDCRDNRFGSETRLNRIVLAGRLFDEQKHDEMIKSLEAANV